MKWIYNILFLLLGIGLLFPAMLFSATPKIVPLPEMRKPDALTVDTDYVYITDFPTLYIFKRPGYKLVKTFGTQGEGPKEFNFVANTFVQGKHLIVCDYVKALFFTKDGSYEKEIKPPVFIWREMTPFGKKFAGKSRFDEGHTDYIGLNLYDSRLRREMQLLKYPMWNMDGDGRAPNAMDYRNLQFVTCEDKLFAKPHVTDFIIDVYDTSGKKLRSISRDYEKLMVTAVFKKRFHDYYRTYSKVRRNYENIKKKLRFYGTFPAIRTFTADSGKLYVVTYKMKNGNSEVLVLDFKGNLLKTVFLPLFKRDEAFFRSIENSIFRRRNNSTFAVKDGRLFQLVTNEEEESWELHITSIR